MLEAVKPPSHGRSTAMSGGRGFLHELWKLRKCTIFDRIKIAKLGVQRKLQWPQLAHVGQLDLS